MSIDKAQALTILLEHGRIPAILALLIGLLCVFGIILSAPLHIQMLTSELSTIADIAVPSGITGSAAHSYFQSKVP